MLANTRAQLLQLDRILRIQPGTLFDYDVLNMNTEYRNLYDEGVAEDITLYQLANIIIGGMSRGLYASEDFVDGYTFHDTAQILHQHFNKSPDNPYLIKTKSLLQQLDSLVGLPPGTLFDSDVMSMTDGYDEHLHEFKSANTRQKQKILDNYKIDDLAIMVADALNSKFYIHEPFDNYETNGDIACRIFDLCRT